MKIELLPTLVLGDAGGSTSFAAKRPVQLLPAATRDLLPYDALFEHAPEYKATQGWDNFYIGREAIRRLFATEGRFGVPEELLTPRLPEHLRELGRLAGQLVETALTRFYNRELQRSERGWLQTVAVTPDHSNVPRVSEAGASDPAYQLKVPEQYLVEIDRILADESERLRQDTVEPLPRLHIDAHLFQPLLIKSRTSIKSSPVGLEPSEDAFARQLQAFWAEHWNSVGWAGCELYLLRNLPKTGVGFFETAGFYPDFLLWLKRGDAQALAFVDPKGLVHWEEEKVALLATIRELGLDLSMVAFIATPTQLSAIPVPGIAPGDKATYLADRHVLLQEDPDYVAVILEELLACLPVPVEATA